MPKSKKEITKNERKILDILMENARQSLIEISEKTGLSRQTVQKTLQKLEKDHVIWGYQAVADEQKKGLTTYVVLIKRTTKSTDENTVEAIVSRKLENMGLNIGVEIKTSFYCNGNFDWVIHLTAQDVRSAKKFAELLKTIYKNLISDIQILEILFVVKKGGILNPDIKNLKQFL